MREGRRIKNYQRSGCSRKKKPGYKYLQVSTHYLKEEMSLKKKIILNSHRANSCKVGMVICEYTVCCFF